MASLSDKLWVDMSDDSDEEQVKGPRNLLHRKRLEREANAAEAGSAAQRALPPARKQHLPSRRAADDADHRRPMNNRRAHDQQNVGRSSGGGAHHGPPHHGGGDFRNAPANDRPHHFDRNNRPNNILVNRRPQTAQHQAQPQRSLAASATPLPADSKKPKLALSIISDLTAHANESARNPSIFGEGKPREDVLQDKHSETEEAPPSAAPAPKRTAAGPPVKVAEKGPAVPHPAPSPAGPPPAPRAEEPVASSAGPAQPLPPAAVVEPARPLSPPNVAETPHYTPLIAGGRPAGGCYPGEMPPPDMLYAPNMYRQHQYGYPLCYLPPTGAIPTAEGVFLDPLGRPTEAFVPPYMDSEQAQSYRHRYPQMYAAAANPMRPPMPVFANPVERLVHAVPPPMTEPPANVSLAQPPRDVVTFSRSKNVVNRRAPPPPPPPPPPPTATATGEGASSAEKKTWAAVASASKT